MEMVEKFSSVARTGINVPCKPWPVSRMAVPNNRAATGVIARIICIAYRPDNESVVSY
jgi:hypothetical protein